MPVPPAILTENSFDSESEEALALRYGKARREQTELVFEFTRDPALLHQYHHIYEQQFKAVHKANRYRSTLDEHDRRSHFLVVRQGKQCVGGARLSIKTPRQPDLLPIEINGFRLEAHFPELGQKELRYAQIGRFCLLPDFRGGTATQLMLWHLYRKSVALGMDVVFGTAPLLNARVYMQNFIAMGLKQAKVHFDINLPDYPMCEEIKFYLISLAIDKLAEKDASYTGEYQEANFSEEV
jgi:predicted GNAT family N-acyltransferase